MKKNEFIEFYSKVVKVLGNRFVKEFKQFKFADDADSLYEEYINQKTMLRMMYGKDSEKKELLDRHKVCACITVAIIKVRLISNKEINSDENFTLLEASKVNEQLAFMSAWELLKGFIILHKEEKNLILPETYHNISFLDTITRSLFMANQLNSLSTPLIANIFYLLEKYCEAMNN